MNTVANLPCIGLGGKKGGTERVVVREFGGIFGKTWVFA